MRITGGLSWLNTEYFVHRVVSQGRLFWIHSLDLSIRNVHVFIARFRHNPDVRDGLGGIPIGIPSFSWCCWPCDWDANPVASWLPLQREDRGFVEVCFELFSYTYPLSKLRFKKLCLNLAHYPHDFTGIPSKRTLLEELIDVKFGWLTAGK